MTNLNLGTDLKFDIPKGKDYMLGQVFASVERLRGTKVKLKTTRQLIPDCGDSIVANNPIGLETFLPIACCHRPKCKSISSCNSYSYEETLVKRTFYYQYRFARWDLLPELYGGYIFLLARYQA